MPSEPAFRFLSLDDVLGIHAHQLHTYGGEWGLRDRGLLISALAQPSARFGGTYLHAGPPEMAAAYLYHIVNNHPFIDGNKRTGLASALVFLDVNGHDVDRYSKGLYELVMVTASGELDKDALSQWFINRSCG